MDDAAVRDRLVRNDDRAVRGEQVDDAAALSRVPTRSAGSKRPASMSEQRDQQLTEPEVCRYFGWSISEFRDARMYGFPRCGWRDAHRGVEPIWSRAAITHWHDRLRALVVR